MIPPRLLLYGLALVAIVGAVWFYGHTRYNAGEAAAESIMAKLVAEANARTDAVERHARKITEDHAHAIEAERAQRIAEVDHARAALKPVRLCRPASRDSDVPGTPGAAPAVDGADTADGIPVSPGRDIGTELVSLAASCQRDHDTAVAWQTWYMSIRGAPPE